MGDRTDYVDCLLTTVMSPLSLWRIRSTIVRYETSALGANLKCPHKAHLHYYTARRDLPTQGVTVRLGIYTVSCGKPTPDPSARCLSRHVAPLLFAACCGSRWGMCLPTASVVVLGAAGAAPLVSTVVGVDFGVLWTRPAFLAVAGFWTPLIARRGCPSSSGARRRWKRLRRAA